MEDVRLGPASSDALFAVIVDGRLLFDAHSDP
jgi:hypothetical protein